jgi:hypothetical protein
VGETGSADVWVGAVLSCALQLAESGYLWLSGGIARSARCTARLTVTSAFGETLDGHRLETSWNRLISSVCSGGVQPLVKAHRLCSQQLVAGAEMQGWCSGPQIHIKRDIRKG